MATEDLYVVAIELGSSNVTGIAGKKLPDGTISVQAVVQEPSSMFIRRGMIFNLNKSAQCIQSIKERIEERLKRKVTQVYVGYGGQGIHSVFNKVSKPLGGEGPITKEMVEELENENLKISVGNHVILDFVPQAFFTGKEVSSDPIGIIAENIEAKYMNIIARPSLKTNIENCFNEVGLHIAGTMLTPISEANALMSDSEKRSGCVLVDFGADTTSVVVYKENVLKYIGVIPLGSANITKDIQSCQLDEQEAEHLKISKGSAINVTATIEEGKEFVYNYPDGTGLTKQKFGEIVEARTKEILVNVAQQIKESGLERGALIGGAIFTGGGSSLKNLVAEFAKLTGISQVRIMKTLPTANFSKTAGPKVVEDRLVGALSVLNEGTQNCCGTEDSVQIGIFTEPAKEPQVAETEVEREVEEEPKPKGPSFFKRIGKKLQDISSSIVGDDE